MRNTQPALMTLQGKWEQDLGELEEDHWKEELEFPAQVAIKASVRLIQIKILLYKIGRVDTGTAFEFVVWRAPSCKHSVADLVFNHTRRR